MCCKNTNKILPLPKIEIIKIKAMDEKVVKDLIDRLIDLSFAEDIGDGDHTTLSCSYPCRCHGKIKVVD